MERTHPVNTPACQSQIFGAVFCFKGNNTFI